MIDKYMNKYSLDDVRHDHITFYKIIERKDWEGLIRGGSNCTHVIKSLIIFIAFVKE